jgi:MATE family multidrug resistance protein
MKKGLIASYLQGIRDDNSNSESYFTILRYFWPEFIAALALYSILNLLDARFIADLKSTTMYATLGMTNGLYHFIVKIAEGMSVGAVIICGQYNGAKDYPAVGMAFVQTFWVIAIIGFCFSGFLYLAAPWIYIWYGATPQMVLLGVPFLRLRALGVLFMFLYFGCIAFLRGIKNTKTPMYIYMVGGAAFVFFDYALIFGKFGFPQMGFFGSATASVIQYGLMFVMSFLILIFNKHYAKYSILLLAPFHDFKLIKRFFMLSWPIVLDKATMAASYVWLGKMIAKMGETAMATFTVVKDMDRVAFLPAIAFAQIITLLSSNNFGSGNIVGIKSNIKKVLFLANIGVGLILLVFYMWRINFICLFDQKGDFTATAASVFPFLAPLVFCDVFQIILSGALRGVADVRTVMWTRLVVCTFVFAPAAYLISNLPIANFMVKFILIYVTFYLSNAIMSAVYINRFRSGKWLKNTHN